MNAGTTRRTTPGDRTSAAGGSPSARRGGRTHAEHFSPVSRTGPESGDFRDRLSKKFAEHVEKPRWKFQIYPSSSLTKTFAQVDALRKGALALSLYPTTDAGGETPELSITFMPA